MAILLYPIIYSFLLNTPSLRQSLASAFPLAGKLGPPRIIQLPQTK